MSGFPPTLPGVVNTVHHRLPCGRGMLLASHLCGMLLASHL
jgi:hypothetical protein